MNKFPIVTIKFSANFLTVTIINSENVQILWYPIYQSICDILPQSPDMCDKNQTISSLKFVMIFVTFICQIESVSFIEICRKGHADIL